jgi:spore coat polysaccharide biosynthesis predicted glycosyltransferase SpsG
VRCRSLARALGVRPLVALRGTSDAVHTALSLGCDVVRGPASKLIGSLRPDVLVVDDPIAGDAKRWIDAARRAGCVVVSVHDLGLGCLDADLIVDGSVTRWPDSGRGELLTGTRYAVLDPAFSNRSEDAADGNTARAPKARMPQVLIALGGGPRTELAREIANVLVGRDPRVDVRIAGGFLAPSAPKEPNVTWVGPRRGLVHEFVRADVAVVGGGVSLYEACASGVASVGVPVVEAQRPTVAAFVKRGAALGVAEYEDVRPEAVATDALALLADAALRRRLARKGRQLVDGRGAFRVAAAIARVAEANRRN